MEMSNFSTFAMQIAGRAWYPLTVTGALLMMLISMRNEWQEDREFDKIVVSALHAPIPAHGVVTSQKNATLLLHEVHDLVEKKRQEMGAEVDVENPMLCTPGEHLDHPSGACASYSTVLAKTLVEAGFEVRKVGLGKDGQKAVHHVLETRVDGQWALMDPSFDLEFKRADGHLASAREVSAAWPFYRRQLPANYPSAYDYKEFYYTNWERIPGATLVFKWWPQLPAWLRDQEVSLRFYFLNVWSWSAILWGVLAGSLLMGRALLHMLPRRSLRTGWHLAPLGGLLNFLKARGRPCRSQDPLPASRWRDLPHRAWSKAGREPAHAHSSGRMP